MRLGREREMRAKANALRSSRETDVAIFDTRTEYLTVITWLSYDYHAGINRKVDIGNSLRVLV